MSLGPGSCTLRRARSSVHRFMPEQLTSCIVDKGLSRVSRSTDVSTFICERSLGCCRNGWLGSLIIGKRAHGHPRPASYLLQL
jgi:hypothetical protein